jgi:hypothetical protein
MKPNKYCLKKEEERELRAYDGGGELVQNTL